MSTLNNLNKYNKDKFQGLFGAVGWFGLFVISSIVIIPLTTILGCLLDIEFIVNGLYAYVDILDAVYAGDFNLINTEQLIVASNLTLVTLIASYVPTIIAMFVRRDIDGGYNKVEANELFKWLTLFMTLNFFTQSIATWASTIPAISEQSNVLAAVGMLSTSGNPLLAVFATGIMAPIVEEITLRRGIQKGLCKINPTFGIIGASVIFGLMHGNLIQGVFAAIMGVGLGYVYYKTNNLWYSTILHMAVNTSSVIISLLGLNEYVVYGLLPIIFGMLYLTTKREPNIKTTIDVGSEEITSVVV